MVQEMDKDGSVSMGTFRAVKTPIYTVMVDIDQEAFVHIHRTVQHIEWILM
jgi:hypothetical protein